MLYENKFEIKTRGLVQGDAILKTELPVSALQIIDPKAKQFRTMNKREFNILENHLDLRKFQAKHLDHVKTWKIVIRSRETKEII